MESRIWKKLIEILLYRKDLIDIIKPFFGQLTNKINNEQCCINEEKYIPFLKLLPIYQLEILHESKIFDEKIYTAVIPKKESSPTNLPESSKNVEEIVREIINEDNVEELKRLIREKGINSISPIKKAFNEVKLMNIPIIIECIIQKAQKCFKYLLINGIENPMTKSSQHVGLKSYEWDCMGFAIYQGEDEIMKILEENGIEKVNNPIYLEAAILSYRNKIAKEIIFKMKENEEMNNDVLMAGLIASTRNSNIKGVELIFDNIEKKEIPLLRAKPLLNYAIQNKSREIFEIFIKKGADINGKSIIFRNKII